MEGSREYSVDPRREQFLRKKEWSNHGKIEYSVLTLEQRENVEVVKNEFVRDILDGEHKELIGSGLYGTIYSQTGNPILEKYVAKVGSRRERSSDSEHDHHNSLEAEWQIQEKIYSDLSDWIKKYEKNAANPKLSPEVRERNRLMTAGLKNVEIPTPIGYKQLDSQAHERPLAMIVMDRVNGKTLYRAVLETAFSKFVNSNRLSDQVDWEKFEHVSDKEYQKHIDDFALRHTSKPGFFNENYLLRQLKTYKTEEIISKEQSLALEAFVLAAGREGFSHGDLHWGNIMIGNEDNLDTRDKVYIIDFGKSIQTQENGLRAQVELDRDKLRFWQAHNIGESRLAASLTGR